MRKRKKRGGSVPGKAPNRERDRVAFERQLDKKYFCRESSESPLFTEAEFELSYRMPRGIYEKIRTDLLAHDNFWVQLPDAAGKMGASTDAKLFVEKAHDDGVSNVNILV